MNNITIYSAPDCPYCNKAKNFLKAHHFSFCEVNVSADPIKAEEMICKSGQLGVPVITVSKNKEEKIVIGFDREKLSLILNIFN